MSHRPRKTKQHIYFCRYCGLDYHWCRFYDKKWHQLQYGATSNELAKCVSGHEEFIPENLEVNQWSISEKLPEHAEMSTNDQQEFGLSAE